MFCILCWCWMSVVCWWWLSVVCVGDSCLLFVVGLWFSRAVDLSLPGVTILMVPGLGVLLLNCWLSVLVVAHFFRCRCPALWTSSCFSLNEFDVYKNNLRKYRYPPPGRILLTVQYNYVPNSTRYFFKTFASFENFISLHPFTSVWNQTAKVVVFKKTGLFSAERFVHGQTMSQEFLSVCRSTICWTRTSLSWWGLFLTTSTSRSSGAAHSTTSRIRHRPSASRSAKVRSRTLCAQGTGRVPQDMSNSYRYLCKVTPKVHQRSRG